MLVIAGADLAWTRIHWRRDQRMSRHEVKEEVKQAEGDRMMKARLRSLRLDRSRRNMLKAVPKATMVVVNPTHYAVAMRYVRAEGGAPIVLAKGVDLIALKIREIAVENDIPIIEDKPLARSLYDAVAVDAVIPPEFYRAVAEIVHLIQSKRAAWPLSRRRLELMLDPQEIDLAEHERVLADAIVDVATELRLSDPTEFIMLVRGEQAANIADLVNSSSELFFKQGALRYGLSRGLRARLGLDAERQPRHGVSPRGGHRVLPVDDRRARAGVEVLEVFFDDDEDIEDDAREPPPVASDRRRAARMSGKLIDARFSRGLSAEAAAELVRQGHALYDETSRGDGRSAHRLRTRLRSAKILDSENAFLCDAVLQDMSAGGMRLVLHRNIGLPPRFGVHDDGSGEIFTVSLAWRRGQTLGVRIHSRNAPRPIKPVARAALSGKYYGIRD